MVRVRSTKNVILPIQRKEPLHDEQYWKPTTRSKKTTRLGPVQVIRPDQYEAFDVDSQLECIRALIPLGLMDVQEVLEAEVYRWTGARYAPKTSDLLGWWPSFQVSERYGDSCQRPQE